MFKPNAMATGIGSLPHKDPDEACRLILDFFSDIPFWPQLPKRSPFENMYRQYSEAMPAIAAKEDGGFYIQEDAAGFCDDLERFYNAYLSEDLDAFRISEGYAAGLYKWLEAAGHLRSAKAIKGQITGPVSFGLQVTQSDKRSILYNDTLRDVIVKQLLRKAQWQLGLMKKIHPVPIIFLDEPYLSAFGSAFTNIDRTTVLSVFDEILSGIDCLKGIHCCGNTDWSLVLDTGIDILSFDAYSYMDSLFIYEEGLKRFIDRGGIIAWGIVPTNESDIFGKGMEGLMPRLETAWDRLAGLGFDQNTISAQSIVTPACGLGTLSVDAAKEAFRITSRISEHIRDSFHLK
ncbi:methionine synthase [bacterium]|nr:methionine synthase [bacterium]